MRRYLVVAHQTLVSHELLEARIDFTGIVEQDSLVHEVEQPVRGAVEVLVLSDLTDAAQVRSISRS